MAGKMNYKGKSFKHHYMVDSTHWLMRTVGIIPPKFTSSQVRLMYYIKAFFMFMYVLGIYIIIQMGTILTSQGDIDKIMATLFLLLTNYAFVIKISIVYRNSDTIMKLIDFTKQDLNKVEDPVEMEIIYRHERSILRDAVVFMAFGNLTLIGWTMVPIMIGQRVLPMAAWYPYDSSVTPYYELSYFHQMSAMVIIAYSNNLLDVMMNSISRQLCCQFELLRRRLELFTNDKLDENEMYDKLVHYIKYQRLLFKAVEDTGNIIGPMALAQFSVSSVVLCSTLYRMAKSTQNGVLSAIPDITYLLTMTVQVFVYCWNNNELNYQSSVLYQGPYACDWSTRPVRFRRALLLLMTSCQRPILLQAGGIIPITMQTFMTIVKSSYTFFTMVNQVMD